jgi:hypothetical protein
VISSIVIISNFVEVDLEGGSIELLAETPGDEVEYIPPLSTLSG